MGIRITPDVTTLVADANTPLSGNVQLVSGTNVTLSQSGQAITVTATPSSGPPITVNDEGTFTVATTGRLLQPNRLTLSGTERSTLSGTGRTLIADVLNYEPSKGVTATGSFNIMDSEYEMQFKRLTLAGNARLTETGTGREVLVDILGVPSGPGITSDGISKITLTGNPSPNTVVDGEVLTDTTSSSSGNQQYSPAIRFTGQGWETNTSASQPVDFRIYNVPVQGSANPTGQLTIDSQINGGGFGNSVAINTNGQVLAQQGTNSLPGYGFQGAPATGMYTNGGIHVLMSSNGTRTALFHQAQAIITPSDGRFLWSTTAGDPTASTDVGFARNASGIIEINSSTIGQFRDLQARNIFLTGTGPAPITQNDYTSGFTVPTNGLLQQPNRATLSGTERATLAGTGRDAISDQNPTNTPLQKVTLNPTSFIIRAGEYVMQYLRLAMAGNTRATLTENARIVNFEFRPPSHLVLAGAGL